MSPALNIVALLPGLMALVACDIDINGDSKNHSHINGAVHIAAGERAGEVSTVNGGVEIGAKAAVTDVRTVNGGVSLGEGASAHSMRAVNGALDLGEQSLVSGDVRTVNGALHLARGARVDGALTNVNGSITVDAAHVVGRLRSVNGSMTLLNGAHVEGGILIEKPHGFFNSSASRPPRVVIGADVSVEGTLRFEREVRLYVSDRARHIGPVEGATPISYQGDKPPE